MIFIFLKHYRNIISLYKKYKKINIKIKFDFLSFNITFNNIHKLFEINKSF